MSSISNLNSLEYGATSLQAHLSLGNSQRTSVIRGNGYTVKGQFRKADDEEITTTIGYKRLKLSTVDKVSCNSQQQLQQIAETRITNGSPWSIDEIKFLKILVLTNQDDNRDQKYNWSEIAKKMEERFPGKRNYSDKSVYAYYSRYLQQNMATTKNFNCQQQLNKPWDSSEIDFLENLVSKKSDDNGNKQYTWHEIAEKMEEQFPATRKYSNMSVRCYYSRHFEKQQQNQILAHEKWSESEIDFLKKLVSKKSDDNGDKQYTWHEIAEKMEEQFPATRKYSNISVRCYYSRHFEKQQQNQILAHEKWSESEIDFLKKLVLKKLDDKSGKKYTWSKIAKKMEEQFSRKRNYSIAAVYKYYWINFINKSDHPTTTTTGYNSLQQLGKTLQSEDEQQTTIDKAAKLASSIIKKIDDFLEYIQSATETTTTQNSLQQLSQSEDEQQTTMYKTTELISNNLEQLDDFLEYIQLATETTTAQNSLQQLVQSEHIQQTTIDKTTELASNDLEQLDDFLEYIQLATETTIAQNSLQQLVQSEHIQQTTIDKTTELASNDLEQLDDFLEYIYKQIQ